MKRVAELLGLAPLRESFELECSEMVPRALSTKEKKAVFAIATSGISGFVARGSDSMGAVSAITNSSLTSSLMIEALSSNRRSGWPTRASGVSQI